MIVMGRRKAEENIKTVDYVDLNKDSPSRSLWGKILIFSGSHVNAIKAFDLCVFRFIMFYCVFGVFVILLSLCFMFYDLLVLVRISV